MNPLTAIKNLNKLNERELQSGTAEQPDRSWHQKYRNSAWIYIGGLPYQLSEGDVISVFSQYGEVVHMNLVRDRKTGKSRGFCFLCYENQRSTILAVDNFNGIKLLGRSIRVDHVENYRIPKVDAKMDAEDVKRLLTGCAPDKEEDKAATSEEKRKRKEQKKKKKEGKRKRSMSPLLPLDTTNIPVKREGPSEIDLIKQAEMERRAAVLNPGTELTLAQLNERIEMLDNKQWPMFDKTKLKEEETFLPKRHRGRGR